MLRKKTDEKGGILISLYTRGQISRVVSTGLLDVVAGGMEDQEFIVDFLLSISKISLLIVSIKFCDDLSNKDTKKGTF